MTTTITFNDLPAIVTQMRDTLEQLTKAFQNILLTNNSTTKKPMDVAEAAAFLKVTEQTIYSYAKSGELTYYSPGKKLYFYETDLIKWIETGRMKTRIEIDTEVDSIITKNAS